MKSAHLWFLSLLLIGCATAADIRNKSPERSLLSDKTPKAVADCVMYRAPAEVTSAAVPYYHFSLSEQPPGAFHILAEIPGQPMGEADFLPDGKGGTAITIRSRWNFWAKDAFWICIQKCASPTKATPEP